MNLAFTTSRLGLLASTALITLCANASIGHAQTTTNTGAPAVTNNAPYALGQIVVTSRKRSEVLQKIPVAVDVVNHKQLQQDGVKSLADLAAMTPGLTYDQGISASDSRPSIRGFSTQRGQPSVAVLVDGYDTTTQSVVSAGGGVPVNLNLLDLERVEIVKGPQAALYGRNAFGGAINYVTQKPTSVPTGELSTEIGNHGDYKLFGTFSDRLTDKISYRASLETDGEDGFYKNTTTGKTVGGHTTQGGVLDVLLTPNSNVTIRLFNEFGHSIYQQGAAVNIASNSELHNYSLASNSAATVPAVVGTIGANASQLAYSDNYPGTSMTVEQHFLTMDDDVGWGTLSSRTMYSNVNERVSQDDDYEQGANPAATYSFSNELQEYTQHNTQVSQEFRITSPDASKLKWLAGLYLFYEDTNVSDSTQYYLDHASFFYPHARTAPTDNSAINPATDTERKTYHASTYGSLGYEVLPHLNATAEVRVAYEGVDATMPSVSRTAISEYNSGVTYGPGGVPLGLGTDKGSSVSRYINPKFTLDYGLTPTQNIYASISHGTKPAGVSLLNISGGGFGGQNYKQEKVWEYEVGDKLSLWNDRIQIAADAYFNDYTDMQVSYSDTNANPATVGVTNAGATYAYGQEIEITARPIPSVTLNVGYSHINEFYKDYRSQVASDLEYVNGDFDGKKVPNVPSSELTANARYERHLAPNVNGFVQVSALYESARYGNDYNTYKLGAFIEPRFLVGLENRKYSLMFYMNNPFNDKTIRSAISYFDLHDNFSPTALAYLPDPMEFGLRASAKF
jgi:outer membrane receptor protein involved in Fe transport